jgi:hypothetical protein
MRPNMGTMKEHGCRGPQLWTCDDHFLPSYYGTAQSVIETHCSPNS